MCVVESRDGEFELVRELQEALESPMSSFTIVTYSNDIIQVYDLIAMNLNLNKPS